MALSHLKAIWKHVANIITMIIAPYITIIDGGINILQVQVHLPEAKELPL